MDLQKKWGFTLAEVLITLAIIGIVATLTIPALIASYQKTVYVSRLQKFFAEFQAGAQSYYASKDCLDLKCTGAFDGATSWSVPELEPNLDDFITKSFKIAKNYKFDGTYINPTYYLADAWGMYSYYFSNSLYSFLTTDGFLVGVQTDTSEACVNYGSVCATVYVDINGNDGPNTLGRDTFQFYLLKDGTLISDSSKKWQKLHAIEWAGYSDELIEAVTGGYYWRNNPGSCGDPTNKNFKPEDSIQGLGCAARIIENGWKMDY